MAAFHRDWDWLFYAFLENDVIIVLTFRKQDGLGFSYLTLKLIASIDIELAMVESLRNNQHLYTADSRDPLFHEFSCIS